MGVALGVACMWVFLILHVREREMSGLCTLKEKRRSLKVSKTPAEIREQWPLHWLVWEGRDKELERKLRESEVG